MIRVQPILASRNMVDPNKDRKLVSMICTYPRWIHAEGRTHRLLSLSEETEFFFAPKTPSLMEDRNLSRNASSSRAIPTRKLIDEVLNNPAMPIFWGKNQAGMQAVEECDEPVSTCGWGGSNITETRERAWLLARDNAVKAAESFLDAGYHKQIINRLLEPFSHIRVLVSATEWSNFFALRIHEDAEPHINFLAKEMKKVYDESIPQRLYPGEWHLPFITYTDEDRTIKDQIMICSARSASLSYRTVDGKEMSSERAKQVHDKLVGSYPMHASPMEHPACADDFGYPEDFRRVLFRKKWQHPELHRNFVGFNQYRATLPGESA